MPHDEWRTPARGRGLRMNRRLGGGGVLFSPPQIAGNVLWLRADKGITIATGVSAWNDQSGAGNNVTQGTGSAQPALSSNGAPGNQPAIVFTPASSQVLNGSTNPFGPNSFTLFIVLQANAIGNSGCAYCCGSAATGVAWLVGNPTPNLRIMNFNGVATESDSTSNATTGWEKWTATSSSAPAQTFRVNGSAHTLNSSATTGAAAAATQFVGGPAGLGFWNGSVAEVIGYNVVLSAAQIATVEGYLFGRYGI